jgi:hypothetical protein
MAARIMNEKPTPQKIKQRAQHSWHGSTKHLTVQHNSIVWSKHELQPQHHRQVKITLCNSASIAAHLHVSTT